MISKYERCFAHLAPKHLLTMTFLSGLLGGCATTDNLEMPYAPVASVPLSVLTAPITVPLPPAGAALPASVAQPAKTRPLALAPSPSEKESRALLTKLIPLRTADQNAWASDIYTAFAALHIAPTKHNFCAAIAVIEQESSFQADPVVPGLSRIVWKEIETRRKKYNIPELVLDAALLKSSPDGRSYKSRINALKTEKQMNALFEDMIAELPNGKAQLGGFNPVRTGGPMQVSVEFAESQIQEKPYPYKRKNSIRNEVFSRKGGVYFGIAVLLDYPALYTRPVYRFADFNAGRYSSRNAAFQYALSKVTGRSIALDGDLLRYQNGFPAAETSTTQQAVHTLAKKLHLSKAEIIRDLRQEKTAAFAQTALYQRLFALAEQSTGKPIPREMLPRIALKSPKIHRKLTTEWFANRVDTRYQNCLTRVREPV